MPDHDCYEITDAELLLLIAQGYLPAGGPYGNLPKCIDDCVEVSTGTGTGPEDRAWYCVRALDAPGTGSDTKVPVSIVGGNFADGVNCSACDELNSSFALEPVIEGVYGTPPFDWACAQSGQAFWQVKYDTPTEGQWQIQLADAVNGNVYYAWQSTQVPWDGNSDVSDWDITVGQAMGLCNLTTQDNLTLYIESGFLPSSLSYCVLLSQEELDELEAAGYEILSGPYLTEPECQGACTGDVDTGTGDDVGGTGSGTGSEEEPPIDCALCSYVPGGCSPSGPKRRFSFRLNWSDDRNPLSGPDRFEAGDRGHWFHNAPCDCTGKANNSNGYPLTGPWCLGGEVYFNEFNRAEGHLGYHLTPGCWHGDGVVALVCCEANDFLFELEYAYGSPTGSTAPIVCVWRGTNEVSVSGCSNNLGEQPLSYNDPANYRIGDWILAWGYTGSGFSVSLASGTLGIGWAIVGSSQQFWDGVSPITLPWKYFFSGPEPLGIKQGRQCPNVPFSITIYPDDSAPSLGVDPCTCTPADGDTGTGSDEDSTGTGTGSWVTGVPCDPAMSTATATTPVVADGVSISTITFCLRDEFGNPIKDVECDCWGEGSASVGGINLVTDETGCVTFPSEVGSNGGKDSIEETVRFYTTACPDLFTNEVEFVASSGGGDGGIDTTGFGDDGCVDCASTFGGISPLSLTLVGALEWHSDSVNWNCLGVTRFRAVVLGGILTMYMEVISPSLGAIAEWRVAYTGPGVYNMPFYDGDTFCVYPDPLPVTIIEE